MKKTAKLMPAAALCLLLIIYLTADPKSASAHISGAITMCVSSLIPALFPFFVLSQLLSTSGVSDALSRVFEKPFRYIFGLSGKGALPLFLGFLGGYPTGVRTVCSMYSSKHLTDKEAQRLLLFTGNTGPAFIIGAAGLGIFGSVKAGFILYAVHIVSAVLIGIAARIVFGTVPQSKTEAHKLSQSSFSAAFTHSVTDAFSACLNVTAFVMMFSVLSGLFEFFGVTDALCAAAEKLGAHPVYTKALITGFLEISSGINAVAELAQNARFSMPAAAFILAWGGVSVHCQALSTMVNCKLKAFGYIIAKLFHGILAAFLTGIAVSFGACETVFSFTGHHTVKAFIFDYLGLFFSLSCGAAAVALCIIRRIRRAKNLR